VGLAEAALGPGTKNTVLFISQCGSFPILALLRNPEEEANPGWDGLQGTIRRLLQLRFVDMQLSE
jgi:hypothetical protein